MKIAVVGILFGILFAGLMLYFESTTGQDLGCLLVASFPLCWGIAGYLFWRWDLGAFRKK